MSTRNLSKSSSPQKKTRQSNKVPVALLSHTMPQLLSIASSPQSRGNTSTTNHIPMGSFFGNLGDDSTYHGNNNSIYRIDSNNDINNSVTSTDLPALQLLNHLQPQNTHKIVSGSQFSMMRNINESEFTCRHCLATNSKYEKLRDAYRGLKLQNTQLEDLMYQQKIEVAQYRKDAVDEKTLCDELKRKLEDTKVENHLFIIDLKREHDIASTKLMVQIDREQIIKTELKNQISNLMIERDDSNNLMFQYKDSVHKYKKLYDDLENETRDIINLNIAKRQEYEAILHDYEKQVTVIAQQEHQTIALQDTIQQLQEANTAKEEVITELNNTLLQKESVVQLYEAQKKDVYALQLDVKAYKAQNSAFNDKIVMLEKELLEQQQLTLNNTITNNARSGGSVTNSVNTHADNEAGDEVLHKVHDENAYLKRALESMLDKYTRICVVAPTVNVNITDKTLTFDSKINQEDLSKFLEKEIFSTYVTLFNQGQSEEASPDVNKSLQVWMDEMLENMRVRISKHIHELLEVTQNSSSVVV